MSKPSNVSTIGATNAASVVVKASQGALFSYRYTNLNAATRYLMIFDAAALPGNGTAPTLPPIPVPSGQEASDDFPNENGRPFANGIVIAHSTTESTLTVGGADGDFDATFA